MGLADLISSGMDAAEAAGLLMNVMWTMIGAVLVYFMQAGFAMCEAGFTRAKNTGNILMKNMMDFVLGSLFFFIFGFAIMHGTDWNGVIGIQGFFDPTSLADEAGMINGLPAGVFIIFHTVFCATAATIVSGSMAERTKFAAYLAYSAAISIFIYPVSGHWIWGGGWLSELGFHDFAGSTAVHMVGGVCALVGAKILVAITAGCDTVSNWSAIIIGAIAGVLVVFSVEFFDKVAKIDDPVGAISVHGVCGAVGTILTGVFSPDCSLVTQVIGVAATAAYVFVMALIIFTIINKTIGLRVTKEEEIEGLDIHEHGSTAYADFNFRL